MTAVPDPTPAETTGLLALSDAATPGPWLTLSDIAIRVVTNGLPMDLDDSVADVLEPHDAIFIAALVNAFRDGRLVPAVDVRRAADDAVALVANPGDGLEQWAQGMRDCAALMLARLAGEDR